MIQKVFKKPGLNSDQPLRPLELPSWPQFSAEAIELATAVLRSGKVNYWTGEHVKLFEREFARYCGQTYGMAVANGTLALEMAMHMLKISPGDEVIVPARGFIACASSVIRFGGVPVFADVDRTSQNMSAATIERAITNKTRAVLFVHLGGWPGNMTSIVDLARKNDVALIEDCSQAHGAKWSGNPVGGFGDVSVFSFCQDKIMTTAGEGGMVLTHCADLHRRGFALRDHGREKPDDSDARLVPAGFEFKYCHNSIGSNFRLTELQAAIGRSQLIELDRWVVARRNHAARLSRALGRLTAVRICTPSDAEYSAYYRYYFFLRPEKLKPDWTRARLLNVLNEAGVPAQAGACPEIYRELAISEEFQPRYEMNIAKELGATSVTLPVHPNLEAGQVEQMASIVAGFIQAATRNEENGNA